MTTLNPQNQNYLSHVAETLETATTLNSLKKGTCHLEVSKTGAVIVTESEVDFKDITQLVDKILKANPNPTDEGKKNLINSIRDNYKILAQSYLNKHTNDLIERNTTKKIKELFPDISSSDETNAPPSGAPLKEKDITSTIVRRFNTMNEANQEFDKAAKGHFARHYFLKVNSESSVKKGKQLPLSIVGRDDKSSASEILDYVERQLKRKEYNVHDMRILCGSTAKNLEKHLEWIKEQKFSVKDFFFGNYVQNKIMGFFAERQLARAQKILKSIPKETAEVAVQTEEPKAQQSKETKTVLESDQYSGPWLSKKQKKPVLSAPDELPSQIQEETQATQPPVNAQKLETSKPLAPKESAGPGAPPVAEESEPNETPITERPEQPSTNQEPVATEKPLVAAKGSDEKPVPTGAPPVVAEESKTWSDEEAEKRVREMIEAEADKSRSPSPATSTPTNTSESEPWSEEETEERVQAGIRKMAKTIEDEKKKIGSAQPSPATSTPQDTGFISGTGNEPNLFPSSDKK